MQPESIDTIAALATAPGEAGVAIIRLSGPRALAIADAVFQHRGAPPSTRAGGTFTHGYVTRATGERLDEALLLIMRAPHSYTGEDTIELQCHGGRTVSSQVLRRVLEAGARHATPGEFTRRAFLNGRMDLVQAEAVLDLIRAQSDRSAAAALEQLDGRLSRRFDELYCLLMGIAADAEAALDFGDGELPTPPRPALAARLRAAQTLLRELLATWNEGALLREGARIVIAGRPNVGKSTLMNALLGRERSIVTDIPGTTRDLIEESFILHGIVVRLIDTAGLRDTECAIEREGIRRARKQLEHAVLTLYVLDASQPLREADRFEIERMDPSQTLVVLNKTDMGCAVTAATIQGVTAVSASLKNGVGVDAIRAALDQKLTGGVATIPHAAISERHYRELTDADAELNEALTLLEDPREDLTVPAITCLRAAAVALGRILGREYHADLLDAVFSRFCVGK